MREQRLDLRRKCEQMWRADVVERANADGIARKADAGLEMDGDRATWRFGKESNEPSKLMLLRVYLDDGLIAYIDAKERTELEVKVKAAGGVRDLNGLIKVRDLGGERCGASATVAMLDEYQKRAANGELQTEKEASTLGTGGY